LYPLDVKLEALDQITWMKLFIARGQTSH
jgi:hypothetical protein